MRAILLLLLILPSSIAFAGVEQISETEFRDLAAELSAKVNLFKEGWEQDPKAEFYGGTTRDYLYWLKGQFVAAHNHEQAEKVVAKLKALPVIDVREFIIGDSDVDIISAQKGSLDARAFGVRKIDFQTPDLLDPETELGKNEMLQGYIPAEKIRLGRDGFHPSENLGNGLQEIYSGKLSVHFASAEDFAKSKYAQEAINHPILLALRYLRVQAINYFRTHGQGFPDTNKLFGALDPASMAQVKAIIEKATVSSELKPLLAKDKFKSWINGAIQKSFRSYTNPTAALELMKYFGVDQLSNRFPKEIEPLNQYVFNKFRDPVAIESALKEAKVKTHEFYRPAAEYFPSGLLYHGTKDEAAFRGILFQGILPSQVGAAGKGLYGVAEADKKFSEEWAGDKQRLLQFKVSPDAKIVDITKGEGKRIWDAAKLGYEEFAERFGVDIIRYPYTVQAFIVKNSAALSQAEGVYRKVLPLGEIIERARTMHTAQEVLDLTGANNLSTAEMNAVWEASSVKTQEVVNYLKALNSETRGNLPFIDCPYWLEKPEVQAILKTWMTADSDNLGTLAARALYRQKNPSPGLTNFVDGLIADKKLPEQMLINFLQNFFSQSNHPAPHAFDWMLDSLFKDSAAGRLFLYLKSVRLTPQDGERLWKVFSKYGAAYIEGDPTVQVAAALLKNNIHRAEVRAAIHASLSSDKEFKHFGSFDSRAKLLAEYFPHEPETDEKFELLIHRYFHDLSRPGAEIEAGKFGRELAKISPATRSIKALLNIISDPKDTGYATSALSEMNLTDEEWIKFFQKANKTQILEKSLARMLEFKTRSKELSRELLNILFAPSFTNDKMQALLARVIAADPNPEIAQEAFEQILRKIPVVTLEDTKKIQALQNIMGSIKKSDTFIEPIFAFIEKQQIYATTSLFSRGLSDYLPLENPEIAARYQALMVKLGDHKFIYSTVKDVERMPFLSKEYRKHLKIDLSREIDPSYKDGVKRLRQLMKEKPLPAEVAIVPKNCGVAFQALEK